MEGGVTSPAEQTKPPTPEQGGHTHTHNLSCVLNTLHNLHTLLHTNKTANHHSSFSPPNGSSLDEGQLLVVGALAALEAYIGLVGLVNHLRHSQHMSDSGPQGTHSCELRCGSNTSATSPDSRSPLCFLEQQGSMTNLICTNTHTHPIPSNHPQTGCWDEHPNNKHTPWVQAPTFRQKSLSMHLLS